MSNYLKTTNFTAKDSLTSGDPAKKIVGSEFDTEFDALQTAIASKADLASPALTGIPTAPTASAGTSTAQLATTAFVGTAINNKTSVTNATNLVTTNYSIVESGGYLYIKYGTTNIGRIDSSGNFTVIGDVTAFGTI